MYVSLVLWCLALVVLFQALTTLYFIGRMTTPATPQPQADDLPKAVVILCLRGRDPFLESCLDAVLGQDYPDFVVRVVVDCATDPAMEAVRRAKSNAANGRLVVDVLHQPSTTCSLKCGSLVQAVQSLDDTIRVVALVDADAIPHPTWLRELVAPLADSRVGVTCGNRWFMPEQPGLGALVRYGWNAGAVVQMVCFKIAWGGSLAIKRSVIDEAGLVRRWETGLCEDTMLLPLLAEHGWKQVFVPSLLMVNRESCTVRDFFSWVTRQLTVSRLYHPSWPVTLAHGIAVTAAPLAAIVLGVVAVVAGDWETATRLMVGLVLFELAFLSLLVSTEVIISRLVARRGVQARWMTLQTLVRLPLAALILHVLYPITLVRAVLARTIRWRGIQYRIGRRGRDGNRSISLEGYSPYQQPWVQDSVESL